MYNLNRTQVPRCTKPILEVARVASSHQSTAMALGYGATTGIHGSLQLEPWAAKAVTKWTVKTRSIIPWYWLAYRDSPIGLF